MAQRVHRSKRSSYLIDLIETSNGFSLLQGTELLNKPIEKEKPLLLPSVTAPPIVNKDFVPSMHPISRQFKPIFKKNNLIFLKGKHSQKPTRDHPLSTPRSLQKYASWFSLTRVHQLEKEEISSWQAEMSGGKESNWEDELEGLVKKYHQQRNMIVRLYREQCLNGKSQQKGRKYLSVGKVREYICDDAYWLMKIHLFLSNLGVINANIYNYQQEANNQNYIFKTNPNHSVSLLDADLHTNSTPKQQTNQLLKTITHDLRPFCDFCAIHCGIVWFQHLRIVDAKDVSAIMKNVNSKNPPLAEKEYEYILCPQCYCDASFPLLLTHQDFKKVSVNDKLEPNKKKKKDKKKKKEKKKDKEKEIEEENEDFDQRDNIESEKSNKDKSLPENEREEDEENREKEKPKDKEDVGTMIDRILSNQNAKKVWSLEETEALLDCVEKFGENWKSIHESMREQGYCEKESVESLILYFLNLPMRGVSKLKEEYCHEEYLQTNFLSNKTNILDMISQQKLNQAIRIHKSTSPQEKQELQLLGNHQIPSWKQFLNQVINLEIHKFENRLNHLAKVELFCKDSRYQIEKNSKLL